MITTYRVYYEPAVLPLLCPTCSICYDELFSEEEGTEVIGHRMAEGDYEGGAGYPLHLVHKNCLSHWFQGKINAIIPPSTLHCPTCHAVMGGPDPEDFGVVPSRPEAFFNLHSRAFVQIPRRVVEVAQQIYRVWEHFSRGAHLAALALLCNTIALHILAFSFHKLPRLLGLALKTPASLIIGACAAFPLCWVCARFIKKYFLSLMNTYEYTPQEKWVWASCTLLSIPLGYAACLLYGGARGLDISLNTALLLNAPVSLYAMFGRIPQLEWWE